MARRILKFVLLAGGFFVLAAVSAYISFTFLIRSEPATVVPDLTGKHVVTTLELLSDLSLNTKIKQMEYSSDIPIHHVISQDPLPGFEIKPGRDVRIILSKGPESVIVPSLTDLSLIQARLVLDKNGLLLGNKAEVHHELCLKGTVLGQSPVSGSTIRRDETVNLLVSLGKRAEDFIMPDLSGLPIDEAVLKMESLRLSLGNITSISIPDQPVGTVINQVPAPGYRVLSKDRVNLTINRDVTKIEKPYQYRTGLLLLRHTVPPGFLNRRIRVRLNSFGLSTDLVDTFVKPGRDLWCFIPTETNTTAFMYEDDVLVYSEVIE